MSATIFLRRLWKIPQLTTSIRPPNLHVNTKASTATNKGPAWDVTQDPHRPTGIVIILRKARGGPVALCLDEMRSNIMPLDLIWLVAVVTAFVIFAGTLYWADHRTRELNK